MPNAFPERAGPTPRLPRRWLLAGAAAATTAIVLAACGLPLKGQSQPSKLPRIAYFPRAGTSQDEVFIERLRDQGYVDGRSVVLEFGEPLGAGTGDAQPALVGAATALIAHGPDVVVATGEGPALAAKKVSNSIPIVFTVASDPVGNGLVNNLARPGGNVTGVASAGTQTAGKSLELAGQVVPGLSEVGVLWSPSSVALAGQLPSIKTAGEALGIRVRPLEVGGIQDFEAAFEVAANAKVGAVIIPESALMSRGEAPRRLFDLAAKYRLPTIGNSASVAIHYGPDRNDEWRLAADLVVRILKSAKPADLPVEEPTKFDLIVNLKLAQAIGVIVPPSLLAQATEVIQ